MTTEAQIPQFTFYLGVKQANWLAQTDVPLFISYRLLEKWKRPRSVTTWALDSGGFTELDLYGKWLVPPSIYAARVRWWYNHLPGMQWAAVQDWVCPPFILEKTGLTVTHHQQYTVSSYLQLTQLQPTIPWAPVLQGWTIGEYIDHIYQYEKAGVNLSSLPIVGIGSIAARQHTEIGYIEALVREVASAGIRLHGFGLKVKGLTRYAHLLSSADSVAWSMHARMAQIRLPECTHSCADCRGCITYALKWRKDLLAKVSVKEKEIPSIIRLRKK